MALAPCLIGYGAIARRLYTDQETLREGNRYWQWIENYIADDYTEAVRLGSGTYLFSPLPLLGRCRRGTEYDGTDLVSDGRTAGDPHARRFAQSNGRVDPDFHSGDSIRG